MATTSAYLQPGSRIAEPADAVNGSRAGPGSPRPSVLIPSDTPSSPPRCPPLRQPAGSCFAIQWSPRFSNFCLQRSIIVPAGLLVFAPLMAFAASPGLGLALVLMVISGLGSAWAAGIDGLLIQAAPLALRNRALALGSAGLMFTQGVGFALWGIAGQYVPLAVVIPMAAGAGVLAVGTLRPDRPCRPRLSRRPETRVVHDAGASRRVHDPGRQHAAGGAGNQAAGAELRGPCRS